METKTSNYSYTSINHTDDNETTSRRYLAQVFIWMFIAMGVSAAVAFTFYLNLNLMALIISPTGFTPLGYVAVFAPLVFSLVINFGFNKISYPVMVVIFLTYAATIGITFSIFGLIYTGASIFAMFVSSALLFAAMAVGGYKTSMDLTKFGSIMYMMFVGAFIASFVNFFLGSAQFDYIVSYVWVAAMIGLTAYYMQMLKRIGAGLEFGNEESKKLVIIGAFILYTTFINLFMSMLRLFGRRR
ncbi:Bax inhibitor-1/YccA family protein [Mucilaginibacter psychrotolerans]|uniref:Bax inhibitor-1/YccA family protein n=1 Tax=Mucilaginibacter psychrotolerans TaxID=1524096 RepID=A0A4Y8S8X2_9SPHI|nr:Bax inhibitor-1/YccA family protein [Mucilaginibacter psychrotolerans]TFF34806.1 Bax inhibitor-1/YccA family protein [Mucilaginibacter psychrotolerans]